MVLGIALAFNAGAQVNTVYFREGFAEGTTNLATAAADAVPGSYRQLDSSGVWYFYGVYRTTGATGACLTQTGNLSHVRFANLNAITVLNDSAYIVTPVLDFGINTISFYNGRAGRRFTIFKTTDTLATTGNWTSVQFIPADNAACDVETVTVNDPLARRLKIVSRAGTDSDIDSVIVTSILPIISLPVTFSTVKASQKNSGVQVEWVTATEINVSRYSIEKSTDGRNFKEAGTVTAKGYSTAATSYSWFDAAPATGVNYYRVKSVDLDGSVKYTGVMRVVTGKGSAGINIAPNPVRGGKLSLNITDLEKGTYTLSIYNSTGQKVFTRQLVHEGGSGSQTLQLPAAVKGGMYNLQLTSSTVRLSKSMIVE